MTDSSEDDAILDNAALERIWNTPCDEDEGPYRRICLEVEALLEMMRKQIAKHEAKHHKKSNPMDQVGEISRTAKMIEASLKAHQKYFHEPAVGTKEWHGIRSN